MRSILLVLLLVAPAWGEVTIDGPGGPIEKRETVQIFIDGVQESELPSAKVGYYPREGVTCWPAQTWTGRPFILFSAKISDVYLLEVHVPRVDGTGKPYIEHAEIEITVGEGDVNPIPGPLSVVLIHETKVRTASQAEEILKLRAYLGTKTYHSRITDQHLKDGQTGETPVWFQPYLNAMTGRALPILLIGEPGSSNAVVELFTTADAAIALIKKRGG